MITKDNIKQLLILPKYGFKRSSNYLYDVWERHYDEVGATVYADFANEKIIYPRAIQADRDGGCNPVFVLQANNQTIDSAFIYYLLRCNTFFDYIIEDVKGMKMPRGKKEHVEKFELRLPSLEEQQRLSKAFVDLDMELVSLKTELQTIPQRKQAILDKYLK